MSDQDCSMRDSSTHSCSRRVACRANASLQRMPLPTLYNVVGSEGSTPRPCDGDSSRKLEMAVLTNSSNRGIGDSKGGRGAEAAWGVWKSEHVPSRTAICRLASIRTSSAYLIR